MIIPNTHPGINAVYEGEGFRAYEPVLAWTEDGLPLVLSEEEPDAGLIPAAELGPGYRGLVNEADAA